MSGDEVGLGGSQVPLGVVHIGLCLPGRGGGLCLEMGCRLQPVADLVSTGQWKWVLLEPEQGIGLGDIRLREPAALYELVINRPTYDAPLALADVRKDA